VYGVERDLTSPGDIESVAESKDESGRPGLDIRLTDAAVRRMNSGDSIVGHDMGLILDGRTVIAIARVQTGIGNALRMTGNFSSEDITRLLDAISSSAPGNH
jgi:preprotein translocase subunit SecD